MINALDWLLKHTLRSVWFGIILLSLIAVYIAIGSGFPKVREFFEKDELAFFNAWPLALLMILMVATLVTVTIERIPFTPVRLGAWIIHTGIVTLVFGAFWHYSNKVEGSVLIPLGQTVNNYFDRWERALYVKTGGLVAIAPLPELPRFYAYDQTLGNADYLQGRGLENLNPIIRGPQVMTAGEMIGVKDLRLGIVGYWPYADIRERLIDAPGSKAVGFAMELPDPDTREPQNILLTGSNMRYARATWGAVDFEHRPVESIDELTNILESSLHLHQLHVRLPGLDQKIDVQVGETREFRLQGYTLKVEAFDPRWRTMDQQIRPMLTLMVTTPSQSFRRQVLMGVEKPTDWLLKAEGAGPLGKRQDNPLDDQLKLTYTLNDPHNLLPPNGSVKYTLFTTPSLPGTAVLGVPLNEAPSPQTLKPGKSHLVLREARAASAVMMAAATGKPLPPPEEVAVEIERRDGVAVEQYVEEVPREKRDKDMGASGAKQVVRVRATAGDWSQELLVPFVQQATIMPWQGGLLDVPGATMPAQLQLSTSLRTLPAAIKLDKFEAEAYGGVEAQANAMIRNFESHITITDRETGKQTQGIVSLNEPVFYSRNHWIFFQSQWDPTGQRWSVLGVGNRPGVMMMALGCGLIIVGIFYAFYIKPIIIKLMKKRAMENAQRENRIGGFPPVKAS